MIDELKPSNDNTVTTPFRINYWEMFLLAGSGAIALYIVASGLIALYTLIAF